MNNTRRAVANLISRTFIAIFRSTDWLYVLIKRHSVKSSICFKTSAARKKHTFSIKLKIKSDDCVGIKRFDINIGIIITNHFWI